MSPTATSRSGQGGAGQGGARAADQAASLGISRLDCFFSMAGVSGTGPGGDTFTLPPPALGCIEEFALDDHGHAVAIMVFHVAFIAPPGNGGGGRIADPEDMEFISRIVPVRLDDLRDRQRYAPMGNTVQQMRDIQGWLPHAIARFRTADEQARRVGLPYGTGVEALEDYMAGDLTRIRKGMKGFVIEIDHIVRERPRKTDVPSFVTIEFPGARLRIRPAQLLRNKAFRIDPLVTILDEPAGSPVVSEPTVDDGPRNGPA